MKKICYLILFAFCCDSFADSSTTTNTHDETEKPVKTFESLEDHVQAALEHFAQIAPDFNKDCLRVWKNFKKNINPHYSYRSWGSNFILWLKQERNVTFTSQSQVGDVFAILYRKGLISKHAVLVLTANAWSYLVYREGIPDIEKKDSASQNKQPIEIMT